MARHLKILRVVEEPPFLILYPYSEGASFRYADLQMEANYVRTMAGNAKYKGLIIDLGELNYFGSEFIGSLITVAREKKNRGGKVGICNVNEQMKEVLNNMALFKLWPCFDTRDDAKAALDQ